MTSSQILADIAQALQALRLHVEAVEDTFNTRQGEGPLATRAHVDPRALVEQRSDDPMVWKRQVAGFAQGVKSVLLEPKRSDADQWDFVDSAGGLLPTIQAPTFSLGVAAAAGHPAWTRPFVGDLSTAYLIHLPNGLRPLTTDQAARWGVSADRITSAARSLLFHRTRQLSFQPFEELDHVQRLHGGDGHDAARCLVAGDVFFSDLDDRFRFALPTPDHFLCVADGTDANALAELKQASASVLESASYPLSPTLYKLVLGKPQLAAETTHE